MDYSIREDLIMFRELFKLSQESLARELGVERLRVARIEASDLIPNNDFIETFYSYVYRKGFNLNLQKELYYKESLELGHKYLVHASKNGLVGNVDINFGRANSDFGHGFYCGEEYEGAASFVSKKEDSSVYMMDFNLNGLNKLEFKVNIDWLITVAYFRGEIKDKQNHPLVNKIIKKIDKSDYIVAPIADNRMFEIINEFTRNEITDEQCMHCLAATYLGNQYVIRTSNAANNISLLEKCYISNPERKYYDEVKSNFQKIGETKVKLARMQYKGKGKYLDEVLGWNN